MDGFDNPLTDLTEFQRDLLFGLAWFELSEGREGVLGLDLKDLLEGQYDKDVHHSRLYPNLDVLVSKGLVVSKDAGRDNMYSLDDEGLDRVEEYYGELSFVEEL